MATQQRNTSNIKTSNMSMNNHSPPPYMRSTTTAAVSDPTTPKDDESIVISALRELQSSRSGSPHMANRRRSPSPSLSDAEQYFDTTSVLDSELSRRERLLKKVRSHPLVDNAVRAYKSNRQYGVEMMEKATLPVVNMIEQTATQWKRKRSFSADNEQEKQPQSQQQQQRYEQEHKKQKLPSISEALAISNRNLNDFNYHLSADASKKISTCLQLLTLANNQISSKVAHLQQIITNEQISLQRKQQQQQQQQQYRESSPLIDENGDTFHDAHSTLPEITQIKTELITTMKKLVHFLSLNAGSSLPEPARSNVRETLLRLPLKIKRSSEIYSNTNGKVLGLANESLDAVSGIIKVFNETLSKAEGWVKEKQNQQFLLHQEQLKKASSSNSTDITGGANSGANVTGNSTVTAGGRRRDTNNEIIRNAIWNRMNLSKEKEREKERAKGKEKLIESEKPLVVDPVSATNSSEQKEQQQHQNKQENLTSSG
ncbi:hypothetical protein WICPIJ_003418 [Wickerhamomyces pijperi]|uniref:Uncharacterized protein n=1 Tax=Wickerhamomyces pijperi TaxID=599730 RepID=A0A9P8Q7Q4_WICPI|nr:hypothetical protein WICPIJ_003418 [Wickerhamomyces pijperi]